MSVWMLSCSTHGRVLSAFRTRSGQPRGQFIAGTFRVTSAGTTGGSGLPQPATAPPTVKKATRNRSNERMDGPPLSRRFRGDDLSLKPMFIDHVQQLLWSHPLRIVTDPEQVVLQIWFDRLDTRKP